MNHIHALTGNLAKASLSAFRKASRCGQPACKTTTSAARQLVPPECVLPDTTYAAKKKRETERERDEIHFTFKERGTFSPRQRRKAKRRRREKEGRLDELPIRIILVSSGSGVHLIRVVL